MADSEILDRLWNDIFKRITVRGFKFLTLREFLDEDPISQKIFLRIKKMQKQRTENIIIHIFKNDNPKYKLEIADLPNIIKKHKGELVVREHSKFVAVISQEIWIFELKQKEKREREEDYKKIYSIWKNIGSNFIEEADNQKINLLDIILYDDRFTYELLSRIKERIKDSKIVLVSFKNLEEINKELIDIYNPEFIASCDTVNIALLYNAMNIDGKSCLKLSLGDMKRMFFWEKN